MESNRALEPGRGTAHPRYRAIRLWASRGAAAAALLVAALTNCHAQTPQVISVWSRVLFGEDGKVRESALVASESYDAAFADKVKAAVARASIQPPIVNGKAATLRTGVELRFEMTSNAGRPAAKLLGISMGPIPPKSGFDQDVLEKIVDEWKGEVTISCNVGADGKCVTACVTGSPTPPEPLRRYFKATVEHWQFEPESIDGKAIEGEYRNTFLVDVQDRRQEDFRSEKFDRTIRRR